MNIFDLAVQQLRTEIKNKKRTGATGSDLIDYAQRIRHYLDIQARNLKVAHSR